MLKGKTIVLGVTGSIAAYKMANVASMLVKRGSRSHDEECNKFHQPDRI